MQLSFPVAQVSAELIDRIRRETVDALHSLPHGGLEIAGVLFGTIQNGEVLISALRRVECEHAGGPALLLSERDEGKLEDLLSESRYDPELRDLDILGWYVSHTRRPFELTGTDRVVFDRFFPGPMQFTAVIQPDSAGAAQFGWFVRAEDGSVDCDCPSYEFTAEPAAQHALVRAERVPAANGQHRSDLEPVPYGLFDQAPAVLRRPARIGAWPFISGLLLLVLVSVAILLWLRVREQRVPLAPVTAALPLRVSNTGTDLRIEWDPAAQVVRKATAGLLEITDAAGKPVRIHLTPAALHNGSAIYNQPSGLMQIHLQLANENGVSSDSIVYFVAREREKTPEQPPLKVETPAAMIQSDPRPVQRAELRVFTQPPAPAPAAPPSVALVDAPKIAVPVAQITPQAFVPVHTEVAPPPPVLKETPKPSAPTPASGRLIWTGELRHNAVLRVTGDGPSAGALNGKLPGFPVKISVHSGELLDSAMTIYVPDASATRAAEAPSRRNGWNVTLYKWDPKHSHDFSLLEMPSQANGWKGFALKSDSRTIPVIVIDWQQDSTAKPE